VFPNITIVTLWSFVQVASWIPVAPGRTLRVVRFFSKMRPPGRLSPRRLFLPLLARLAHRRATRIMTQDQWIVGEAQIGTHAGVTLPRGPAHAQEERVEHLLQEVARRLGHRYRDDAPEGTGTAREGVSPTETPAAGATPPPNA
jgi:hypothetical protein